MDWFGNRSEWGGGCEGEGWAEGSRRDGDGEARASSRGGEGEGSLERADSGNTDEEERKLGASVSAVHRQPYSGRMRDSNGFLSLSFSPSLLR